MPDVVGYDEAHLLPTGIQDQWTGNTVSYDRAVFLTYDHSRQQLTILSDAGRALNLSWPLTGYEPYRRIISGASPAVPLRQLVRDMSDR